MYVQINQDAKLDVFAEELDVCITCINKCLCPLIEALQAEVAILRYESISIENCGLFIQEESDKKLTL